MPSSQRALRLYVHAIEMVMPIEVAAAMPPDVASGELDLRVSAESRATGVTEVMQALDRYCVPRAAKRSNFEYSCLTPRASVRSSRQAQAMDNHTLAADAEITAPDCGAPPPGRFLGWGGRAVRSRPGL